MFASIRGGHNWRVNAADRFVAALPADGVAAAEAELAPDVVMLNPGSDEPVVGRESGAGALRAVDCACDEFGSPPPRGTRSASRIHCVGWSLRPESATQRCVGVDLVESDESLDKIVSLTVLVRPLGGLMALSAPMSGGR